MGGVSADAPQEEVLDWRAVLGGSAFEASFGGPEDGGGPRWKVWGHGSWVEFSQGGAHEGTVGAAWLGADVAVAGGVAVGVAVTHAKADQSVARGDGGAPGGDDVLETSVSAVHPYVLLDTETGGRLWAMAGAGAGEVVLLPDAGGRAGQEERSDLEMHTVSFGATWPMGGVEGVDAAVKVDGGYVRLGTDAGATAIGGQRAEHWRVRGGVEVGHAGWALGDGGARVAPFVAAALRRDGGDGAGGAGLEVEAGATLTVPGMDLEVEARARHFETDAYRERGASLDLRMGRGLDGAGLSLAVSPRWGEAVEGGALWEEGVFGQRRDGGGGAASASAVVGYGFSLSDALVTPYVRGEGRVGDGGEVGVELGAELGVEYKPRAGDSRLTATLSNENAHDEESGLAFGLLFSKRF